MYQVRRVVTVALLVLCLPGSLLAQHLPVAEPEEVGMSSARLERLTATLQGYVDRSELAGGVAIVVRRGKVAYLRAFGQRDRESGQPMRTDSIFRIASQTKAIVSTAILMLQEEGRLLIGDPVSQYIPEFEQTMVAVPRADGGYDLAKGDRKSVV